MRTDPTLLPCPFCGGGACILGNGKPYRYVECLQCHATGPVDLHNDHARIGHWNTRADVQKIVNSNPFWKDTHTDT